MMPGDIGRRYQSETKYQRGNMPSPPLGLVDIPETYKRHGEASRIVSLPPAETSGGKGLWRIVNGRRSRRDFTAASVSLRELSQLLWATQGITARAGGHDLRAAPSAGALYPCETYLVANRVSGLDPGVYHYLVLDHCLELLRKGDVSADIAAACLDQQMAADAAVVFVWTAIVDRSRWKYGERCYRYLYLDAGHIGAHLSLAAEAMGLGSCMVGALYDDEVNAVLGVDGERETAVYAGVVGKPQRRGGSRA
jgi:SagB-type dehydrogenase family enzyme